MSEKPKLTLVYQEPPAAAAGWEVMGELLFVVVLLLVGVCVLGASAFM